MFARSLIDAKTLEILFDNPSPKEPVLPQRFPVTLHKLNGKWNEFYMGHVVTHLDLETWCAWKGYKLVVLHVGTRTAHIGERTDLF